MWQELQEVEKEREMVRNLVFLNPHEVRSRFTKICL